MGTEDRVRPSSVIQTLYSGEFRARVELFEQNGRLYVRRLDTGTPVLLNGRELQPYTPTECASGDRLMVGGVEAVLDVAKPGRSPTDTWPKETARTEAQAPPPSGDGLFAFKQRTQAELLQRISRHKSSFDGISEEEFRSRVREMLVSILSESTATIPPGWDTSSLLTELLNDFLGLGPLEKYIADDTITEIMVNRPDQVYIEREGKLILTNERFLDNAQVLAVIQRIIQPLGRRIDESMPYVDARLRDGSRVHAIIPPLALGGPKLTIRKFARNRLTTDDLVRLGSMSRPMARFLESMVQNRANIIVSGGSGTGKTTLLNVLSNYIPDSQRIITIEDAAELSINKQHVVALESRPPNLEGKGEVTIRELVRNSLRMRPDRIVIGECRGGEALDMLQAMNTGHDGSLTTIHANSPRDTLARLETLVLMAGVELPSRAIREQIASAINFIVQTARLNDGSRKITHITEITGLEGNSVFSLQDIFVFRQQGTDAGGRIIGRFTPTGTVPRFTERLRARGTKVPMEVFTVT
ncbi:MAG: CpaF family protein [candidate division WOR-3 bacterium]